MSFAAARAVGVEGRGDLHDGNISSCRLGLLNLATAGIYADVLVTASRSVWDKVLTPRQHCAGVQCVQLCAL